MKLNVNEPVPFDLEFDGRQCLIHPMSAKEAREVATKLLTVTSRALKEAAALNPRSQIILEMLGTSCLLEHAAHADLLEWLTGKFLPHTEVERDPNSGEDFMPLKGNEDLFFAGEGMGRWFRWLAKCVEVNCGSFFGELQRQAPLLKAKMPTTTATGSQTRTASQSPST